MLWNLIFDFFVTYIFGGTDSNLVQHHGFIGYLWSSEDSYLLEENYTDNVFIALKGYNSSEGVYFDYISIGDYLSFIATIITIVAILLFCIFIIKKIIAIMFRLATGSSAF